MDIISTIYLKELTNIDEIFKENSRLPNFIKKWILSYKKIFGVVTIKENGMCILPYQNMDSFFKIKLFIITKILEKLDTFVVLSKKLQSFSELKESIIESKIKVLDGKKLSNYLIPEIIEYICKMSKKEVNMQEITLLVENLTIDLYKLILELANCVKRIQIVSDKMKQFTKLENELETKFGIACQISNNKRKSLLKSKIIINLDYFEEQFNQFAINPKAIVIDINKETKIHSKAFSGIHIQNYQINYDNEEFDDKVFENKLVYESKILNKSYEQIRKNIQNENVRVTNLLGINGVIHESEYEDKATYFIK